jgi:hypothetical protein
MADADKAVKPESVQDALKRQRAFRDRVAGKYPQTEGQTISDRIVRTEELWAGMLLRYEASRKGTINDKPVNEHLFVDLDSGDRVRIAGTVQLDRAVVEGSLCHGDEVAIQLTCQAPTTKGQRVNLYEVRVMKRGPGYKIENDGSLREKS